MTERQELRFNKMCFQLGLYTMDLPYESQCNGYKKLKELVESGIPAATREEYIRWSQYPNTQEINSIPELKYLTFLHHTIAGMIRINWVSFIDKLNS